MQFQTSKLKFHFSFLVAILFSINISSQTLPSMDGFMWKTNKEAMTSILENESNIIGVSTDVTESATNYKKYFDSLLKSIKRNLSENIDTKTSLEAAVSEVSLLYTNLGLNQDDVMQGHLKIIEILKL